MRKVALAGFIVGVLLGLTMSYSELTNWPEGTAGAVARTLADGLLMSGLFAAFALFFLWCERLFRRADS
jgi:hypothetical protein